MSYFEQAKRTCPICRSEMTEVVDERDEQDVDEDFESAYERYRWESHRCTSPACGIMWQYGDICRTQADEARVIHIYDEASRPKRAERSIELHIEWSKDEDFPDGSVLAMVFVNPKPFRKRPPPLNLDLKATGLVTGDRDRALREAFTAWRLRAFA